MGRGQQMPQVTSSPMGIQRNKPANKHSEQTPADFTPQMHTFIILWVAKTLELLIYYHCAGAYPSMHYEKGRETAVPRDDERNIEVAVMITDCGAERDTVAMQWMDRRRRGKEVESEGRGTLRMNTFKAAHVSTQSTGAPLVRRQLL
ncbi:hypothetical protein EYF80_010386 [Liparis tanakae]|uniref:Uncharacterized protein n=1 Tax=Liparis tanakae TaxID=230148 RepID=A0A4Z2IQ75_9TELE|nr:hypothetical protein EYF80_010386 [Liparis tanakae]